MNTLEVKDFSAGYIPSDDQVRGRKNGLLRMTNVSLDESNALVLTRGTVKLNNTQFGASVHSIYSRQLGNTKFRYVGLADGSVLRDDGSGNYATTVVANGGPAATIRGAFGALFNNALIVAGQTRVKDDGTTIRNLGIGKPTAAVTATAGTSPQIGFTDSFVLTTTEGTATSSASSYVIGDTDTDTFRFEGYRTFAAPRNLMDYGGGLFGREDDKLYVSFRCPDSSLFVSFKITFYFATVDGSPDSSPDFTDYYEYTWDLSLDNVIRGGLDQWSVLQVKRSDFFRVGSNNTKNWTNTVGVRFSVLFSEAVTGLSIADGSYVGSDAGPLNGKFDYIQVNVNNNGAYVAKSPGGPGLDVSLELHNGYAVITPQDPSGVDTQVNEVWIYRRKSDAPGSDPLGRYLRIKQLTSDLVSSFNDQVDDVEAALINEPLNQFLMDVQDDDFDDDVYFVEVNYFERTLYMSPRQIWQSEPLNPDAVDVRFTLKLSGDSAETNLWMIKTGPSTLLVGTTAEIYSLDGDLTVLPDGTQNLIIRPLGIKQPPVNDSVCIYKGTLFYIGTDGLNALTATNNQSFNGNLDLLFRKNDRYGQLAFYKSSANRANYDLAAAGGRLFMQVTLSDTSRTLMVYDFQRQYWYNYLLSAAVLHVEEDDTLVAGFADGGDFYVRIIDVGTAFDYNASGQQVFIRFPIYDDNLPLNRKDAYTLKLKLDTGGASVNVRIYRDESSSYIDLGTVATSGGEGEVGIDIYTTVAVAKQFQLELSCDATNYFKLTQWSIEYEPRPKQTLELRIPPINYGTASRKRIPAISFLIDTLGNNVTFTPNIDGTLQSTSTVNSADKQVHNHFFLSDKKGYTIGGILKSTTYFEFYDMIIPRIIEILPDPAKFFVIPNNNLGTQCRKRIIAIAFIIDTQGANVTFTPYIDGVAKATSTVNTTGKRTYIHYFTTNEEGTDIGGILDGNGNIFEYYAIDLDECISEKMPIPTKRLRIPQENYGTPARKRHSSYKFVINTRGSDVVFTPRIDETDYPTQTYNTSEKQVVEYFFTSDTIGIDIGGLLTGVNPFEFYGPITPELVEKLPDRLKFLVLPENNFGIAAKKRVRTIPLIINTNGSDVTFTPIVDNVSGTPATFNTPNKQTVLYYFTNDSFGIDYKGTLSGANPFEFYQMLNPEDVQVLPVGKKFDQVGPIEFAKLGKVLGFRLRLIAEGTSLSYTMYSEDVQIGAVGTIITSPNIDQIYEVGLPKGINTTIFRVELAATSPFHRYYARFKVNKSGMETESQWMLFGSDPDAKLK